ncbi:MAG: mechanosensitive ion channel [Magnetococcales bacterium]|nr:mechanosensitive ion channel [Magnetococcales bacterium]
MPFCRNILRLGIILLIGVAWAIAPNPFGILWAAAPNPATTAGTTKAPKPGAVTLLSEVWKEKQLDLAAIQSIMELLNKELEAIPAEATDESPDGQWRTALKKRLGLLQELELALPRREAIAREIAEGERLDRELDSLEREIGLLKPPTAPTTADEATFQKLSETLSEQIHKLEQLDAERKTRRQLLEQIPDRILKTKEQRKLAEEELPGLEKLLASATGTLKRVAATRIANVDLLRRVTDEQVALWTDEQNYEKLFAPRRDRRLDLESERRDWLEANFRLYRLALAGSLETVIAERTRELAAKETAEAAALSPRDRFQARLETEQARADWNIARLTRLKTHIAAEAGEQERRLKIERDELKNLQELVNTTGIQGPSVALLKSTFRVIGKRRLDLEVAIPQSIPDEIERFQARRVEIDLILSALRTTYRQQLDRLALSLTREEQPAFLRRAEKQLETSRQRLTDEKRLAFDLMVEYQRLDLLPRERRNLLDELERFVLSKVFWIQDAEPFGLNLLATLRGELLDQGKTKSLLNTVRNLLRPEAWKPFTTNLEDPWSRALLGFGAMAALGLLIRTRQRLHQLATHLSPRESARTSGLEQTRLLLLEATAISLLPLGLLLAIPPLLYLDPPQELLRILLPTLFHIALFLWLYRLNRILLLPGGHAETLFAMPRDLAATLCRGISTALFAFVVFLLPWSIFDDPAFEFEALPRIGSILFEVTCGWAIYGVIRPSSPLIAHTFRPSHTSLSSHTVAEPAPNRLAGHWPLINRAILLFMAVVIAMDVMGYRFGAIHLAENGLLTLATIFGLVGLYRILARIAAVWIQLHGPEITPSTGDSSRVDRTRVEIETRKLLKLVLTLTGLWLLVSYWNVDEQLVEALGKVTLYSVPGEEGKIEFVTLSHISHTTITILFTFWFVHFLPSLFGLLLFSWWHPDRGVRYALITISRYGIVIVGLLVAASWMRLEPGKIGWVVAAISVGLGFGLQEIVANFVSGIILLMERPIRVGDIITVGSINGEVTRVNIRATTVVNWDLQEILIPNRDLITKEVTNWTLSNNQTRLLIAVGVAYGTDVDHVSEVLLELARAQPEVLKTPPPQVFFMKHGESSLDFELRIFLPHTQMRLELQDRMNKLINKRFLQEGIEMPFPQREIHLRGSIPQLDTGKGAR